MVIEIDALNILTTHLEQPNTVPLRNADIQITPWQNRYSGKTIQRSN